LRVGGGEEVRAPAGPAADDLAGARDDERAGLRPAGVDADDHGLRHCGVASRNDVEEVWIGSVIRG
jgi:hypothetical protein